MYIHFDVGMGKKNVYFSFPRLINNDWSLALINATDTACTSKQERQTNMNKY